MAILQGGVLSEQPREAPRRPDAEWRTNHQRRLLRLTYARKWEPVDNDPIEAQRLLLRKRGELQTVVNRGTVPQPTTVSGSPSAPVFDGDRRTLW